MRTEETLLFCSLLMENVMSIVYMTKACFDFINLANLDFFPEFQFITKIALFPTMYLKCRQLIFSHACNGFGLSEMFFANPLHSPKIATES